MNIVTCTAVTQLLKRDQERDYHIAREASSPARQYKMIRLILVVCCIANIMASIPSLSRSNPDNSLLMSLLQGYGGCNPDCQGNVPENNQVNDDETRHRGMVRQADLYDDTRHRGMVRQADLYDKTVRNIRVLRQDTDKSRRRRMKRNDAENTESHHNGPHQWVPGLK